MWHWRREQRQKENCFASGMIVSCNLNGAQIATTRNILVMEVLEKIRTKLQHHFIANSGGQFNWISTDCSTGFSTERLVLYSILCSVENPVEHPVEIQLKWVQDFCRFVALLPGELPQTGLLHPQVGQLHVNSLSMRKQTCYAIGFPWYFLSLFRYFAFVNACHSVGIRALLRPPPSPPSTAVQRL